MKMETFQKQLILALLAYAAKRDIDPVLVCRHSGIDEKVLGTNSKIEITPHQIEGIWKNLLHISNDPLIGLHFGESMQLAALSVVGQIIETSRTIGEALTVCSVNSPPDLPEAPTSIMTITGDLQQVSTS